MPDSKGSHNAAAGNEDNEPGSLTRRRRALESVRALLCKEQLELADLLAEWIRDGVDRRLVRLDANGQAMVHESWAYDWEIETITDMEAFKRDYRAVHELRSLLVNGVRGMLHAEALQRLGQTPTCPAPFDQALATRAALDLELIGSGACSTKTLAQLRPLLDAVEGVYLRDDQGRRLAHSRWDAALQSAFVVLDQQREPIQQVEFLLGVLGSQSDVPPQFFERRSEHLIAAREFVRGLRLRERKAPKSSSRRGPKLTRAGAAQGFARCFGVRIPDAKKTRRRK